MTMNKNDKDFLVQKIRSQYTEKETSAIDELKALDAKVKKPANIFAYAFGSVSAIIMGSGMSLVMTDMSTHLGINSIVPGVVIGVVGLGMCLANYPIYKRLLESRRKAHAQEIIELSDRLMNS